MSLLLQRLCPIAKGALLGAGEEGGLRAERGTVRLSPPHAHTCRGGRSRALLCLQGEAWLVPCHGSRGPAPWASPTQGTDEALGAGAGLVGGLGA